MRVIMKRAFILLFAMVAMVACTETSNDIDTPKDNTDNIEQPDDENTPNEDENTNGDNPDNEGNQSISITVGVEGNDTRIQLNEELHTVWNEDDLLTVFYKSATRQQWQFQGATGDTEGTIEPVGEVTTPEVEGNIVVLYPDNEAYLYNEEDNSVRATVTSTQSYAEGSYGMGGNILVAQSTTNNMTLRNVYGWLKVELTGASHAIASITLKGNKGEQLAGDIVINTEDATASFVATESPTTAMTLTCEGGAMLNTTTATTFYIGLLPQTFTEGITIVITDTNGGTMTKSTDKSVAIDRNAIQGMRAFDYVPEEGAGEVEKKFPGNNSIWYNTTGGQLTIQSSPTDANITNHIFGACANGQCYSLYAIEFDAAVTTINQLAFYNQSTLETIYLPHSVKSIGQAAFATTGLKEVHIGSGIESIGPYAFTNSRDIQKIYIRATTPPTLGDSALLCDSPTGGYSYIGALIYVPESAVETYKQHASWMPYANYIVGYDFINGETVGEGTGGGSGTTSLFSHRILILDHTDMGCGYCPIAMDRLHALAASEFKEYYHEVTLHAGKMSSSDPAYSKAAADMYSFQGVSGLPTICLNYFGGFIPRGDSDDYFVNTTMRNIFNSYHSKHGAAVGIAMETSVSGGMLNINVDVTSALEQEYYLAVWVLENNIQSPNQSSGYKEHHFVYNHALREIVTPYSKRDMAGEELATLPVGFEVSRSYQLPIDASWNASNLEVIAIVSADNDASSGGYEVVNCAVCPINSTLDYEYISGAGGNNGDDNGSGDVPEGDDENAIKLSTMSYSDTLMGSYLHTYSFTDGGNTSLKVYVGDYWGTTTSINDGKYQFTTPRSKACNAGQFHADSVKIDGISKTVTDGTMTVLQGKMSLTLQFADSKEHTFVYTF